MIPDELRDIVITLHEKAQQGDVQFVAAADLDLGGEQNDVVVAFPNYSINIYSLVNEQGVFKIHFVILNTFGKIVTGVSLTDSDPDFYLLDNLLTMASRKVSGIDDALNQIRDALKEPGTLGAPQPRGRAPKRGDLPF